jgi:hypothetical protein
MVRLQQNVLKEVIMEVDKSTNWKYPDIEDDKATKYN